jgi:hypothetical protein
VAGPERGEQRIVRLAGGPKATLEAADIGPARALRPLERGLARAL